MQEKYMTDERIYSAYEYCSKLYGNSDFFTMENCMMNKLVEFAWEMDNVEISFPKGLEIEAKHYCLQRNEDLNVCISNYKKKQIFHGEKEMIARTKSAFDSVKFLFKRKQHKDVIAKLKSEQRIGSPVAGRLRSRNNVNLLEGLPPKRRDRRTMVLPQNESSSEHLEIGPDNSHLENIDGDSNPKASQDTSTTSIYDDNDESQVKSSGYSYCTIL
ncbi:unnamed protein product [Rodentolepis nana]|uniref:Uncharacterized protein n=1 Tax=Rodentolepis nana TaxID=102285 RepID=A0A0R3TR25_RODNA|nr:unnamed protein product [Rodentolepis nana]